MLFWVALASGQVTVNSSNGYTVTINISPQNVVPTSASCPYGYNYNVEMAYDITFSGSNIPGSLYTLQGNLGCASDNHFFNLPNNGGTGSTTSTSNQWRGTSDCNSATTSSLGCNGGTIQINGPGIPNQTIAFSATTLPIELTNFKADQSGDDVKIIWETASEKHNDFFTLEKSSDGVEYEVVEIVSGQGNSNTLFKYEVLDRDVYEPTYYRLSQTDFDGSFKYEGVIFHDIEKSTEDLELYPNPNNGSSIQLSKVENAGTLSIYSTDGRLIYQTSIQNQSSITPNLESGHYIVHWSSESGLSAKTIRYIQL